MTRETASETRTDPKQTPNIQKAATGIQGFDDITDGGLPRGRTSLILGSPGTGKTIFALQTLVNGVRQSKEPGIFVAFEESSQRIVENATFGWDLAGFEESEIFFMNARLSPDTVQAGAFDFAGMLAALREKVKQMGARRIVFDSLDVILSSIDEPGKQREEVYRIHDWLSEMDLTGIVTTRPAELDVGLSLKQGFLPFIADCVIELSHRVEDRVAVRSLRVIKYRGSDFRENEAPLVIGPTGLEVASVGPPKFSYAISEERISTGVESLDEMLRDGYFRGTSTLITGAPGTAKTTLAAAFAEAACERGEPTLYIGFDQAGEEIVRDMRSVNVHLAPHVESGLLCIMAARAEARGADEHLLKIRAAIAEQKPRHVVIDPLSAITKAGSSVSALSVVRRLIYLTKQEGITLLCTSLLEGEDPATEQTPLEISTMADTWIHLSYQAQEGERNRALTIVKSRGTGHSNQVRELILSDDGLRLTNVYAAGGEVLMGTMRWEKEQEMKAERERMRAELERRRQGLEMAEAEAQARKRAIEREVEARRIELAALEEERKVQEELWRSRSRGIVRQREVGEETDGLDQAADDEQTSGRGA